MADWGNVELVTRTVYEITAYSIPPTQSVAYGNVELVVRPTIEIARYDLAGTIPCPPVYTPPTTGQLWPRSQK